MSQHRRDDYDITPDWDDLELDWLDDLDTKTPSGQSHYEPGQTHFEPERNLREAQPRQIPTEPYQKPAPAPRRSASSWEDIDALLAEPDSDWEDPTPIRREPTSTRREPVSTRREPSQSARGQAVPAREQGQPVSTRRQPVSTSREPVSTRRQPTSTRHQPDARGRQGQPSRRSGNAARREVSAPGASPWEQEQSNPRYRKQKRRRKSNAPLIVLIVVLVAGMCFAGWQLGSIFLNYRRDRSAYNDLAAHAISQLAEFDAEEEGVEGSAVTQNHSISEIPISVDWDYLRSINANVVGWLYCPGTVISYPVVQTSDHDYYLSHGFDGSSNVAGTLFADRNSVSGITQSNYIIYGHNMKDNSMFGTFANYVDKSYYDNNPILYYLTPDSNYRIELLCAHIAESTEDNYPTYFSSISDYQNYLNRITSNAFWVNNDVLSTDYQLMSFSTCTYTSGYNDPRLLVHGMMIPLDQ